MVFDLVVVICLSVGVWWLFWVVWVDCTWYDGCVGVSVGCCCLFIDCVSFLLRWVVAFGCLCWWRGCLFVLTMKCWFGCVGVVLCLIVGCYMFVMCCTLDC